MPRFIVFLSMFIPCIAFASDPTGLFVLFVGAPFFVVSIALVLLAFKFPKSIAVISSVFMFVNLPFMGWASSAGYMQSSGIWLLLSFTFTIISLVVSFLKLPRAEKAMTPPSYDWNCPLCGVPNKAGISICHGCKNNCG